MKLYQVTATLNISSAHKIRYLYKGLSIEEAAASTRRLWHGVRIVRVLQL